MHILSPNLPGLYCPYTVSLATALPLVKYGTLPLQERFLAPLLRRGCFSGKQPRLFAQSLRMAQFCQI
ncbi:hypothetical protein JCM30471_31140 [Desulfuromonas carbonis]|nr:hypothetical protein DBW_0894 [Desulfuromonas sp. DDH964]